ncbi:MAG: lipopolysaccharide biosynthesis protein [Verrucomicrobiales bacterium]
MTTTQSRGRRNRSIRSAVSASLLSKGSSAVLQFLALPLAARVLGRDEFGIYATVSFAVLAVAVLQLGVGPALARNLSAASADGDRREEGRVYLSGAVLVVAFALAGFLLAAALLIFVPLDVLFGAEYAGYEATMRPALWTGALLMTGQVIVSMTDRVREGYMEASIVNAWSAAGNLVGALVVLVGVTGQPTVSFLLLAVYGPNIVARLASTVLLLRKRPWLVTGGARPRLDAMRELIGDGLSFSATSFIVYLVEFVACALIVGRVRGPQDVAVFQIFMAATTAFHGMLRMVGTPLWAAIVDAKARGDWEWVESARRRYHFYLAALTLLAAVLSIGLGPWVLPRWYGEDFVVERAVFASHAVFLFAMGWRHVNRYIAIGLGLVRRTVASILSGLAVGLFLAVFLLPEHGLWGLFAGLSAGILFIPGWQLPLLVRRCLNDEGCPAAGSTAAPRMVD